MKHGIQINPVLAEKQPIICSICGCQGPRTYRSLLIATPPAPSSIATLASFSARYRHIKNNTRAATANKSSRALDCSIYSIQYYVHTRDRQIDRQRGQKRFTTARRRRTFFFSARVFLSSSSSSLSSSTWRIRSAGRPVHILRLRRRNLGPERVVRGKRSHFWLLELFRSVCDVSLNSHN